MEEAGRGSELVSIMLAHEIHPQRIQAMGAAGSLGPKPEASVGVWVQECQLSAARTGCSSNLPFHGRHC